MMRPTFISRLVSGFVGFKEAYFKSGLQDLNQDYEQWEVRRLRYEVYWALYENTAYMDVHKWLQMMKTSRGLYRYIRGIYNPSFRIGEFWKMHIWGGPLDPEAGNGKVVPSSLPIAFPKSNKSNEESLRAAIAQVWDWSNWGVKKDICSLWGTVLGDVALMVCDDATSGRVYLDIVHPGTLYDVQVDARGNVKAYTLVEERWHPDVVGVKVSYSETAERDGDAVIYRTYLNGQPYAWTADLGEEWHVDYGFIPMVLIKHNDVGLRFGWSELHPGRAKFHEVDDLASKTHDHIRKAVDPAWLFSGVSKAAKTNTVERERETPTENQPQPEREQIPAIYASNPQAKARPLVVEELDIEAITGAIGQLIEEIERDYPELQWDEQAAVQTNSSRAIRVARQRAEGKAYQRRPNYDDALARAQMMAITMGARRRYDAFKSFGNKAYDDGALDHYIANRAVFGVDPMDELEIQEKFWAVAAVATPLIGLDVYLKRSGWSDEDRAEAVKAHEDLSEAKPPADNSTGDEEPENERPKEPAGEVDSASY